jgi:hypothetical protein
MHTIFDSNQIDWNRLCFQQQQQQPSTVMYGGGGAFVAFRGMPYQRGAGVGAIFRSLLRYLMPLGREVASSIGRQGLESGANILSDVLDGQKLGDAAALHGRIGARKLMNKAVARLEGQKGSGGLKRRRKSTINKEVGLGIGQFTSPSHAGIPFPAAINSIATPINRRPSKKTAPRRRRRAKRQTGKRQPPRKATAQRKPRRRKASVKRRRRDALGFY